MAGVAAEKRQSRRERGHSENKKPARRCRRAQNDQSHFAIYSIRVRMSRGIFAGRVGALGASHRSDRWTRCVDPPGGRHGRSLGAGRGQIDATGTLSGDVLRAMRDHLLPGLAVGANPDAYREAIRGERCLHRGSAGNQQALDQAGLAVSGVALLQKRRDPLGDLVWSAHASQAFEVPCGLRSALLAQPAHGAYQRQARAIFSTRRPPVRSERQRRRSAISRVADGSGAEGSDQRGAERCTALSLRREPGLAVHIGAVSRFASGVHAVRPGHKVLGRVLRNPNRTMPPSDGASLELT
jgi:hypothetical protein